MPASSNLAEGTVTQDNIRSSSVNAHPPQESGPIGTARAYIAGAMQEWNLLPALGALGALGAPGTVESPGTCISDSSSVGTTDHQRRGGCFAAEHERDAMCAEMESRGIIVAELEGIGPSARGRLSESVDDAIE